MNSLDGTKGLNVALSTEVMFSLLTTLKDTNGTVICWVATGKIIDIAKREIRGIGK